MNEETATIVDPVEFDAAAEPGNIPAAVAAGLAAALVGAVVWALIGYATGASLGLVAILVGAIVGVAVRAAGKGHSAIFQYIGAGCAALGWALGTVLVDEAFVAKQAGRPFLDVVAALGAGNAVSLALSAADGMDLLFLGIACYEGYKFSRMRD